ncbi:hypothetical protein AB0I10_40205 [Streptomyces sp. NPDC050636]|uniref:hypothetical protein n=1 Tax=Streptomyces sp. NPDC050636 TaxID=3154510 RepID=UPI003416D193
MGSLQLFEWGIGEMRNSARRLAVIAIGGAFLAGIAPAQAADLYAATSASSGWVSPQHVYAYAKDIKADGNSVYSQYARENSGDYYLHNKSGNGTTATSGAGKFIYALYSCVSLDWEPDTCAKAN